MKQMLITSLFVASACAFAIPAVAGGTNFPAAAPVARIPAAAENAVHAASTEQFRGGRFPFQFAWQHQQQQQQQMCRVRSFFDSDVAKPLEVVYFARHGSVCGAGPFYGFVLAL